MIDLQQRLSSSLADLQAAHHQVSVLENKAHSLEIEKTLLANAEQRLTAEVSQVPSRVQKPSKCWCSDNVSNPLRTEFMKTCVLSVCAPFCVLCVTVEVTPVTDEGFILCRMRSWGCADHARL